MGSLRFWFEVYCNIEDKEKIRNLKNEISKQWGDLNQELPNDKKIDIPNDLVDLVFGTTGWKSRIEIENIEYLDDYFGNKLNLPQKILPHKKWFFAQPYFWGKFAITFKTTENIKTNVLFPLLKFIENYGFLGGKNNIGYGRVEIIEHKKNNTGSEDALKSGSKVFEILSKLLNVDRFYCGNEKDFERKIKNAPNKIVKIIFDDLKKDNLQDLIKELIIKKSQMRNCLRHVCEKEFENCYEGNEFKYDKEISCNRNKYKCGNVKEEIKKWIKIRHRIFGERGEGSKIMPFVIKENAEFRGGFISLVGIDLIGVKNEL
jgi:CRISPR-associated protein Cmr1